MYVEFREQRGRSRSKISTHGALLFSLSIASLTPIYCLFLAQSRARSSHFERMVYSALSGPRWSLAFSHSLPISIWMTKLACFISSFLALLRLSRIASDSSSFFSFFSGILDSTFTTPQRLGHSNRKMGSGLSRWLSLSRRLGTIAERSSRADR